MTAQYREVSRQALIKVLAAALNPIDLLISSVKHPAGASAVPHVPGVEGLGEVMQARSLYPGTRVRFAVQGGFVSGALAEYVCADESACVPVPDRIADADAAAVCSATSRVGLVVMCTAHRHSLSTASSMRSRTRLKI